jgi:hypothetical protein
MQAQWQCICLHKYVKQEFNMPTKIITAHFTSAGVPQPGLTPSINITQLNLLSELAVVSNDTLSEIGNGWYRYNFTSYDPSKSYVFTIDGGPLLTDCERYQYGGNESYAEDITTTVLNEPILNHTVTGSVADTITRIKADTATLVINDTTMAALLNTMLKYQRNRTRIDAANAQMIIYDDDCETPLTIFDLRDLRGMPSVQEVCERIPQTCA